jgi:glutamate racemase
LKPLLNKKIDTLVLGCTHYPILKKEIRKIIGPKIKIISQDEIVPKKLKDYLVRHPEIETRLTKHSNTRILVTDKTKNMENVAKKWFGKSAKINLVEI